MPRYFNGGTQPLVVEWGEGVIMPGEYVDHPGPLFSPWTVDEETEDELDAPSINQPTTADEAESKKEK